MTLHTMHTMSSRGVTIRTRVYKDMFQIEHDVNKEDTGGKGGEHCSK